MTLRASLRPSIATALLALLLASTAVSTKAVDVTLRVRGTIGDPCVKVAYRSDVVTEVIQKRTTNHFTKQLARAEVDTQGRACVTPIRSGDILIVLKDGEQARKLTVPVISASLQPATDTISGVMGTGSTGESVVVTDRVGARPADVRMFVVDPAPDGTYLVQVTPDMNDLGPGDSVEASFQSADDDHWTVRQATRAVSVRAGSSRFTGVAPRGSKVTLTLKHGPTVRATASLAVGAAVVEFAGDFRSGGRTVKVKPGDTVVMTGAASPRLTVLVPQLSVTATDGGTLDATCFPGGRWFAMVAPSYALSGVADGTGAIHAADITGDVDLEIGAQVKLSCEAPSGSGQLLTATVQ